MSKRKTVFLEVRINTPNEQKFTVVLMGLTFTVNKDSPSAQYKHIKRIIE
ncbi:hypothetical protein [Sporolactobacillus pectinivorans]|nr:hypothetical protein [Sporolactobacillus pectinivorans]